MKRLNPDTGKPFKIGDPRPSTDVQDGKVLEDITPLFTKNDPKKEIILKNFGYKRII